MRRLFLPAIIIVLAFCSSCAGGSASVRGPGGPPSGGRSARSGERFFWHTQADGLGLVVIGSSVRRLNRDEALGHALDDAARKVAIFSQVTGIVQRQEIRQSGFLGYSSDTQAALISPQDYQGYVEHMEYDPETDVLERDNAFFVRVRFPGIPGHLLPRPVARGGRPDWILSPPSYPGFYTGIGYGAPHMNLRDAVVSSYESAIFHIVEGISSEIMLNHEISDGGGFLSVSDHGSSSEATLEGFYILETWIDPATKAVWTLGVAKRPVQSGAAPE